MMGFRALLRRWPVVLGLVWLAAVLAGAKFLLDYAGTAAAATAPPSRWPAASALQRNDQGPTLLMVVHPRCACTRASVSELQRLMAATTKVKALALVVRPAQAPEGFGDTESVRRLGTIPAVTVVSDLGGAEADRFHLANSGHTLLYDAQGRLAFSGGLTPSRGHEGDSIGRQSLSALIDKGTSEHHESPVFGCPIHDPHPRSE
jgi:hypothetical protein